MALEDLTSYISNRQQIVQLRIHKSRLSICLLLMVSLKDPSWDQNYLLLFINDIDKVSEKMKCIAFADDTVFYEENATSLFIFLSY